MQSTLQKLASTALLLLLQACATVDFDADKPVSQAYRDTDDTRFGQMVARYADKPANESGFHIVTDPVDALAIRLLMILRAERSIDAQYYLIDNDVIGKVFLNSLLRAADRGVRVRLLIDDINATPLETKMAGLADHPNIELRLFNPFANRSFRLFDAWDFSRLNRRMHNKSLTVDNQVTLIGGRNIAEEYFSFNDEYNFGDLDTLAVGPVVAETSGMFDRYWNHQHAIPYQQLSGQPQDGGQRLQAVRDTLEDNRDALSETPYADAVRESLMEYLEGEKGLIWAPYQLVFDSPDKSISAEFAKDTASIVPPLRASVLSAEHELLVVSPYFVPNDRNIEIMEKMQDEGVQISILTNSLASSDHILVHGGYSAMRKAVLKTGALLYETRGDLTIEGTEEAGYREAKSSLHTKAFIVDSRFFYMGSFNWDPRSTKINTELGVIIDSPAIARPLLEGFYAKADDLCYRPFLDERGRLRWRENNDGRVDILEIEPDTTFYTRLKTNLGRVLPIRDQL